MVKTPNEKLREAREIVDNIEALAAKIYLTPAERIIISLLRAILMTVLTIAAVVMDEGE